MPGKYKGTKGVWYSVRHNYRSHFTRNQTNCSNRFSKIMETNGAPLDDLHKGKQALKFFNLGRTSLQSVLSLFNENKEIHGDIPALLQIYNEVQEQNGGLEIDDEERFPLIVLEGLDGCGKSTIGKLLARKINAEKVTTPPQVLSTLREKFTGHYCLHAPFYFLGNYVAAMEVLKTLKRKPVVMDRFWHSTTAFALAQLKFDYSNILKDAEIPEKHDVVYEWPKDLLKPDAVILLNVSEKERIRRLSRRKIITDQEELLTKKEEFRKSVMKSYNNMSNPSIEKVEGDKSVKDTVEMVYQRIQHLL